MGFKPTIFVYLLVIIIHQRVQFSSRRIPNDALNICLMIADRKWLDVSSQFQALINEVECAIGLPTAQQSQRIDITYFVFLRSISFRSEKSSRVAAVLNSISSDLQPVSTSIIIGKSSFSRGNFLIQRVRSFDQGKSFKVICARAAPRIVNLYIVSVASFQVGFQPVNIASLVSKLIWNIISIQTPGRLNLVPRARRVKEAV